MIRDAKEEFALGKGIVPAGEDEAAVRVPAACARLDRRVSIEPRTAPSAVQYTQNQRDRSDEAGCRRIEAAVQCAPNARARRMAERESIHAALEERGFIRRTRGGAALLPSKPEFNS